MWLRAFAHVTDINQYIVGLAGWRSSVVETRIRRTAVKIFFFFFRCVRYLRTTLDASSDDKAYLDVL
jgi:hypothetical protein